MRAGNSHRKRRGWCALKYSAMIMGLVSSYAAASVPIEQSRPIGVDNAPISSARDDGEKVESAPAPSASPAAADSSTAYLLNTIEQMRQELMELRGQLEEQGFQLERLQQENRDRYLDLDERISRLNQSGGKTVASGSRSPSTTTTPVKKATGKSGSSSKVSGNEALKGEEEAYQAAFGLIRGKQFDQAREALKKQLTAYPKGRYADNAQYWLGEVEMAQGQYQPARDAFQSVLNDYPGSPKVPDASYKLGRLHDLLGDKDKARSLLESVIKKYPDTAAARLSDTYLRAMDGS